jgi:hypothetical protein
MGGTALPPRYQDLYREARWLLVSLAAGLCLEIGNAGSWSIERNVAAPTVPARSTLIVGAVLYLIALTIRGLRWMLLEQGAGPRPGSQDHQARSSPAWVTEWLDNTGADDSLRRPEDSGVAARSKRRPRPPAFWEITLLAAVASGVVPLVWSDWSWSVKRVWAVAGIVLVLAVARTFDEVAPD